MSNTYKNYVQYIIELFKEEALDDKKTYDESYIKVNGNVDDKDLKFNSGQMFTWSRVLDIIQQQAELFNIDLKEIKMDNINPENDLLKLPNLKK